MTSYVDGNSSAVSPKFQPALKARVLASATIGVLPKRLWIHCSVGSVGRVYSQLMRPRAKKFLERSASRGLVPDGLTASRVSEVIGTS